MQILRWSHSHTQSQRGRGQRNKQRQKLSFCLNSVSLSVAPQPSLTRTHSHIDMMCTGTAGDRLTHRKVTTTVSHEESHRKPGGQRPGDPLPSYLQNRTAGRPGPSPEGSRNLPSGPRPGLNLMEPSLREPGKRRLASGGHKGATGPVLAGATGKCSPDQRKPQRSGVQLPWEFVPPPPLPRLLPSRPLPGLGGGACTSRSIPLSLEAGSTTETASSVTLNGRD